MMIEMCRMQVTYLLFYYCYLLIILQPHGSHAGRTSKKWRAEKWVREYQNMTGRLPPVNYKTWIDLAKKRKCITKPKHYKQIYEDLGQLTIDDFKRFFSLSLSDLMIHSPIRILHSNEFGDEVKHPFGSTFAMANEVIEKSKPFTFVYQSYDEAMIMPDDFGNTSPYQHASDFFDRNRCYNQTYGAMRYNHSLLTSPTSFIAIPQRIPMFSTSKLNCFLDILIGTLNNGRFGTFDYHHVAWEHKDNRAIFRGTATGINYKEAQRIYLPLTAAPRYKLYELSKQQESGELSSPVTLDFRIVRQNEGSELLQSQLNRDYPVAPWMDQLTQFYNKYLVIVDGNGWPDRLSSFLRSGSLVFLSTIQKEWVINQLIPWEHYVPVKPDLSDLVEKLDWAYHHDEQAKKIAMNALAFAKNNLRLADLQCYNALLMAEYQRAYYEAKEALK